MHNPVSRYINEVILIIWSFINDGITKEVGGDQSAGGKYTADSTSKKNSPVSTDESDMNSLKLSNQKEKSFDCETNPEEPLHLRSTEWAQMLEAVTQRRSEVLTPENLENMWTKGRNYKKKDQKKLKLGSMGQLVQSSGAECVMPPAVNMQKELPTNRTGLSAGAADKTDKLLITPDAQSGDNNELGEHLEQSINNALSVVEERYTDDLLEDSTNMGADGSKSRLKRSNSTSALRILPGAKKAFTGEGGGPIIPQFYSPDFIKHIDNYKGPSASDIVLRNEGHNILKLRCRVSFIFIHFFSLIF